MKPFIYNTTPTIVFRPGAAKALGDLTFQLLGSRILFVTDPGIMKLGLCNDAINTLKSSGIEVHVFDAVEADPSLATLMKATCLGQEQKVSGVIGFGGGSSLDVAKLAALLLGSGEDIDKAWGLDKANGPRLPLVLVPTTAGTGSEVTPISIITVEDDEKRGVSSRILLPDMAVLDPTLTHGLPSAITAATGVDAMVHAIEAYSSKNANNNLLSKAAAKQALELLAKNIEIAVHDGSNASAREAMLLGSLLAGQAFANSPVAGVHALAYPIGGRYKVPHGLSNALVLPHVLSFNRVAASQAYAEIARIVFPQLTAIGDIEERSRRFIEELVALSVTLGLPQRLRDVGIPQEALPSLAKDAMKQERLLVNNPKLITERDALEIYASAW